MTLMDDLAALSRSALIALVCAIPVSTSAGEDHAASEIMAPPGAEAEKREPATVFHERADKLVAGYHQSGRFDGAVIIATRDQILFEAYNGEASKEFHVPFGPETRLRLASVSKSLTAALVMALVEDGELGLDQTVSDFLADYPDEQGRKIKIEHLLTHSSGIPNYQYKEPYQSLQNRALLLGIGSVDVDAADMVALFSGEALLFEPGTKYLYSNANYILLQAIIERLTGRSFEDVLEDLVLMPLGMVHTGLADYREMTERLAEGYSYKAAGGKDPSGCDRALQGQYIGSGAAGALYSTPRDMIRFAQGIFGGRFFRNSLTLAEMIRPRREAYNADSAIVPGFYISSFQAAQGPVAMIGHDGWGPPFTANLQYFPESGLIVFAADNVGGPGGTTYGETVKLTEDLVRLYMGEDVPMPQRPADLLFADLIESHGLTRGAEQFLKLARKPADERDLNSLGYHYLGRDLLDEAIVVFATITILYPQSANAFDSLAEAKSAAGDDDGALVAARKALELAPDNAQYRLRLDQLTAGHGS